ncbi:MAG: DUF2189 domain-containing protein, partial [Alphaproteobacteria bacterium]|nr:DUF2189 domain-containing protein [Alphaproteobacteria bacterium]
MASETLTAEPRSAIAPPVVRRIGPADLKDALVRGVDDFRAVPTHAIFLCLIYSIVGLALGRLMFGYGMLPLLFPLVAGFALLGPVAAVGLYEMSRWREAGLPVSWKNAFDVARSPSLGAILTLGGLLLAIFLIWLDTAQAIYDLTFGDAEPGSVEVFLHDVLATPSGWALIIIGNVVGLVFAAGVLAISAIS